MRKYKILGFLLVITALTLAARPASATTMAACSADFSTCYIPENVLLQFPAGFLAISGDVVLEDPSGAVSDVFRIFNDVINTGQGTGLGTTAFLYSSDDSTPLPAPSTYSANVQFIPESTTSAQTDYLGNGTLYVLAAPEPSSWILFAIGSIALLIAHRKKAPVWKTALFLAMALVSLPAFSQEIPTTEPLSSSIAKFDKPLTMGPAQNVALPQAQAAGLAFYTANYTALGGAQLPFNIVGTDPALGANTTTVNVILVPLHIVFAAAGGLGLDATAAAASVAASPIFAVSDYSTGGTDLGVTQYGDALLRAQYWNLPGFSRNYHVLLGGPAITSTLTVTVPPGAGNLYRLSNGNLLGIIQQPLFDALLNTLVQNFTAPVLPIFLTDNVFLSASGQIDSTCCVLGYHNSEGPPIATAQTWIFAAYVEPGVFGGNAILDVQALSHEVGEWMNDPFVGVLAVGALNFIPPAVLPGQDGACIFNFESADPLEAPPVAFTQVTGGNIYHLTDQVFLPWYLHTSPSFSVNGFYSYLNTFPTFSTLCGPG